MQEGQPQRRRHLRRPQLALDPGEDRLQGARAGAASGGRGAARRGPPARRRGGSGGRSPRGPPGRARARSRAPRRRPRGRRGAAPRRGRAGPGRPGSGTTGASAAATASPVRLPDQLVEGERPAAGGTGRRELLVDPGAQARRAEGRGGHGLERRVEMAEVGRPDDDVGEEPGQRRRLDRDGSPAEGEGGPGDPSTAPEQVDDRVVGGRGGLDPRRDEPGREGRRKAREDRERQGLGGPARDLAMRHRRGFCQRDAAPTGAAPRRPATARRAAGAEALGTARPGRARRDATSRRRAPLTRRPSRRERARRPAYGSSSSSGSSSKASSGVTSAGMTRSRSSISSSSTSSSRSSSRSSSSRRRVPFVYGRRSVDLAAVGKLDLPVVAGVLEDLADDDPHVLRAEGGDAGGVLVAVGDQLEEPGRHPRLDDADADPVRDRDEVLALGDELDVVAGVDLGQDLRAGQLHEVGEAGLPGLLDEDGDGGLAGRVGGGRPVAGLDEEKLEPVDVPLGDAVRRVEGERLLVVLAGPREVAQLPERLRQAVLGLGVGAVLQELAVRLGRLLPAGRGGAGDRLVGQRSA